MASYRRLARADNKPETGSFRSSGDRASGIVYAHSRENAGCEQTNTKYFDLTTQGGMGNQSRTVDCCVFLPWQFIHC